MNSGLNTEPSRRSSNPAPPPYAVTLPGIGTSVNELFPESVTGSPGETLAFLAEDACQFLRHYLRQKPSICSVASHIANFGNLMSGLRTLVCLLVCCSGCAVLDSTEQETMAKRWCLNIRASQIIPVYPLTADLRPGDLFVVPYTVDSEVRMYQGRGFMPLTGLIGRVSPDGYQKFYPDRYGQKDVGWPFSTMGPSTQPACPRVAFPTYSFKAERQDGIDLAVPVEGVALGLDVLNARKAMTTIEISGGYTYGLDETTLRQEVRKWLREQQGYPDDQPGRKHQAPTTRTVLSPFAPEHARDMWWGYLLGHPVHTALGRNPYSSTYHLRVVSRVFLATAVTVSIQSSSATALQGKSEAQIRQLLQEKASANVSYVSSSDSSITLRSDFPEPLVIGYHAFDVPIGDDGHPKWHKAMETGKRLSSTTPPVPLPTDLMQKDR